MLKKIEIKKTKLLLVEGIDALHFFIAALDYYKIDHIQVLDFGGIKQLEDYIKILKLLDNYDIVETIVIVRDAETDANGAVTSVSNILKRNFSNPPLKPFSYASTEKRLAFMIFPGFDADGNLLNGTLEDLCLGTVDNDLKNISNEFIDNLNQSYNFKCIHKTKLHNYLTINDKFVGSKIGEASKYGAWKWEHSSLTYYKNILEEM
ncbi:MAG: hypothetical protein RBR93_11445 [Aliarcobacter butzleri]|nr:hypothetical protein [Aliarcobacter butzleri]